MGCYTLTTLNKINVKGKEYSSIKEMCEENGVDYVFYRYMIKHNKPFEDIFKYKANLCDAFERQAPLHLEIGCGKGGHNFPFKPMLAHQRNQSGMVDMSMCQKNIINLSCGNRNLLILIQIWPLLHSTVYQNVLPVSF